jgi:hypothetical protein
VSSCQRVSKRVSLLAVAFLELGDLVGERQDERAFGSWPRLDRWW